MHTPRPIWDGERFIEEHAAAEAPSRVLNLADELADAGVPERSIAQVEGIIFRESLTLASEAVRRLLLSLGRSPAGKALERAALGSEQPLSVDAASVGTSKQALAVAEKRVKGRLQKAVDAKAA